MFGSLRFRLPALFLLGILLAGLVASLISIRFFQSYNRARAIDELRAEWPGIVALYASQAGHETVPYQNLVRALGGDRIFWVPAFRGVTLLQAIPDIPASSVNMKELSAGKTETIGLHWRGKSYLGVAQPEFAGLQPLRGDRRRQADVAAAQPLGDARRAARPRVRGRHRRRGPARLLSLSPDHGAAAQALARRRCSRVRRVRRRGSELREGRTRSRISRGGSQRWRRSSPSPSSCRATS